MACTFCGADKVYATGLCSPCYQRKLRTGKLEFVRKWIKAGDQCAIEGCFSQVVAKGLCDKHYQMDARRGSPLSDFGYGSRSGHDLYDTWAYQARVKERRVPEWDDFWVFVADVAPRPSSEFVARRHNVRAPWGPLNFTWAQQGSSSEGKKGYIKNWRKKNPLRAKNIDLKRTYGISIEDYLQMYSEQDGKCQICGAHGEMHSTENGRTKTLVVDHCHRVGGRVRALLCSDCNKALGGFKDSRALLIAAAEYLDKHSLTPPQLPDIKPLP